MIRHILRVRLAWCRCVLDDIAANHRQVGLRMSPQQWTARARAIVDTLFFVDNGKAVRIDMALWESEMDGHLLTLTDGIPLCTWAMGGADA